MAEGCKETDPPLKDEEKFDRSNPKYELCKFLFNKLDFIDDGP